MDLLRRQATALGKSPAFVELRDDSLEGKRLSFAELDREARRIASWLQQRYQPGERVLLLFSAAIDFLPAFFGCIYAGLIAIPAPAPEATRRKRTLPRLRAIVVDADVACVLSTADVIKLLDDEWPDHTMMARVVTTAIPPSAADDWHEPSAAPDDPAYLQYTSGSTSTPKGVIISHRNVLHHCHDLRAGCGYARDSISLTWLPHFHDYGLIEGLLVPLQNGTPCYVMSPFAFLRRPFAWLDAINRLRATNSQAPNFAYDQCVRRIKPEQLATLELSCLRNLGNGAEPINPAVLESFIATFGPYGLAPEAVSPAYGLAEATLMMTCQGPGAPPHIGNFRTDALAAGQAVRTSENALGTRRITSCGRPLGQIRIAIVDPGSGQKRPDGDIGEVWIADDCVALGYWQRDADTRETFQAYTTDGEGPFLRTGDLGFMDQGELYLTSRIKDLIIVAGVNHHPQDIEWTVERCHPLVRPGHVAAASSIVDGEEKLIIAFETERRGAIAPDDLQDLVRAVRQSVAREHEVHIHAIAVLDRGSLPKTASGKVQRRLCASLGADSPTVLAYVAHGSGLARTAPPSPPSVGGAAAC